MTVMLTEWEGTSRYFICTSLIIHEVGLLYAFMCAHIFEYMCTHMCGCVEVRGWCWVSSLLYIYFLSQCLSLKLETTYSDSLADEGTASIFLSLCNPQGWICRNSPPCLFFFFFFTVGSESLNLCSRGRHFTSWSIVTAPRLCWFKTTTDSDFQNIKDEISTASLYLYIFFYFQNMGMIQNTPDVEVLKHILYRGCIGKCFEWQTVLRVGVWSGMIKYIVKIGLT